MVTDTTEKSYSILLGEAAIHVKKTREKAPVEVTIQVVVPFVPL